MQKPNLPYLVSIRECLELQPLDKSVVESLGLFVLRLVARLHIQSKFVVVVMVEVDGMKRVLFKVILPALAIGIWVLTCYPVCNKAEGFDFFLFWILFNVDISSFAVAGALVLLVLAVEM